MDTATGLFSPLTWVTFWDPLPYFLKPHGLVLVSFRPVFSHPINGLTTPRLAPRTLAWTIDFRGFAHFTVHCPPLASAAKISNSVRAAPFGERSKILNSVRASNLASNCSKRLWLHARAILVAMENYSNWPGEFELRWLRTYLTYVSSTYASSFSPFCLCACQNANSTLSLQSPMKFGNIVRVETYDIDEDHDNAEARFLQPSIRLRYNYCTVGGDLVGPRTVAKYIFFKGGEAGRAMHCTGYPTSSVPPPMCARNTHSNFGNH